MGLFSSEEPRQPVKTQSDAQDKAMAALQEQLDADDRVTTWSRRGK